MKIKVDGFSIPMSKQKTYIDSIFLFTFILLTGNFDTDNLC